MRNDFPRPTHFIGCPVPPLLASRIEHDREWMREKWGCRSGQRTPLHVTLVPPFVWNGNEKLLLDAVAEAAGAMTAFESEVDGYGTFSSRTLYVSVEKGMEWNDMRSILTGKINTAAPGTVRREKGDLVPHITVANRDIPQGGIGSFLSTFSSFPPKGSWMVDTLAIYRMEGGRWRELSRFTF